MDAFEVMDNPKDSCKTKGQEVDAEEIQSVATETAGLRLETACSGIGSRVLFDDVTGIAAADDAIQIVCFEGRHPNSGSPIALAGLTSLDSLSVSTENLFAVQDHPNSGEDNL